MISTTTAVPVLTWTSCASAEDAAPAVAVAADDVNDPASVDDANDPASVACGVAAATPTTAGMMVCELTTEGVSGMMSGTRFRMEGRGIGAMRGTEEAENTGGVG